MSYEKALQAAVQALFEDGCGEPKIDAATAVEAAAPFIRAEALTALAYNTFGPGEVRDEILRVVRDVHELDPS